MKTVMISFYCCAKDFDTCCLHGNQAVYATNIVVERRDVTVDVLVPTGL